jgi:death-on-curing protein
VTEPSWITNLEAVALNHRLTTLSAGWAAPPRREFARSGARTADQRIARPSAARPFDLAAAYAFAIARGHVFLDGDKRRAHAVAAVFLLNHGIEHLATEEEVVAAMIGVAEGSLSEAELAAWFRDTSGKRARQPRNS